MDKHNNPDPWPGIDQHPLGLNVVHDTSPFAPGILSPDNIVRQNEFRKANLIKHYQQILLAYMVDGRKYAAWFQLNQDNQDAFALYYWIFLVDEGQARIGDLVYIQPSSHLFRKPCGYQYYHSTGQVFEVVEVMGPQTVKCLRRGV